jgi:single-strand DNA-binding protein
MAGTTITVIGNATDDAQLKYTPNGAAVASWTVAVTERVKDGDGWKDGSTTFFRCTAWREMAEFCAESIAKGMRLIVQGRFKTREYEKDGQTRTSVEIDVDEVGPSLRYAVAQVKKMQRSGGQSGQQRQGSNFDDPWASQGAQPSRSSAGKPDSSLDDNPPF